MTVTRTQTRRRLALEKQTGPKPDTTSQTNLNNLPGEIIDLIADYLRSESAREGQGDAQWLGIDGWSCTFPKIKGKCRCKDVGGNRRPLNDDALGIISDSSLALASASKRMREILFDDKSRRHKFVRYCDAWCKKYTDVPTALKSKCEILDVIGDRSSCHTIDQIDSDGQLVGLLQQFPNVRSLRICWDLVLDRTDKQLKAVNALQGLTHLKHLRIDLASERSSTFTTSFEWAAGELGMLLRHLQHPTLEEVDIWIQKPISGLHIGHLSASLGPALGEMHFPKLEKFNLGLSIDERGYKVRRLWMLIEESLLPALRRHHVHDLHLKIRQNFPEFRTIGDDHLFIKIDGESHLAPHILPSRDRMLKWARKVEEVDPEIQHFSLHLLACVGYRPHHGKQLLDFTFRNPDSRCAAQRADSGRPAEVPNTSPRIPTNQEADTYEVNTDTVQWLDVASQLRPRINRPMMTFN